MIRRSLAVVFALLPVAAVAQDLPLPAACSEALPSEAAYVEAITAEGWTLISDPADRLETAVAVNQPFHAMIMFPHAFEDATDARAFAEGAEARARLIADADVPLLSKDELHLTLEYLPISDTEISVTCSLAALHIPALDAAMGAAEDRGMAFAYVSHERSDAMTIDFLRFDVPVLARLQFPGRDGILLRQTLTPE